MLWSKCLAVRVGDQYRLAPVERKPPNKEERSDIDNVRGVTTGDGLTFLYIIVRAPFECSVSHLHRRQQSLFRKGGVR